MNYYNLAESVRVLLRLYSALFNPFTFALQQICPGVESVVVLITDLRILRRLAIYLGFTQINLGIDSFLFLFQMDCDLKYYISTSSFVGVFKWNVIH